MSLPLDKAEAIIVFEAVMGYKPQSYSYMNKTDEGWIIQDGECLPIGGGGVIIHINQENRTVYVSDIFCV